MNIIIAILGRRVKNYDGTQGTVVGAYFDRGILFIVIENPEGGLYTAGVESVRLVPRKDPE